MASITVQGVCKQFGTQIVLDGVSVELRSGEITGLVGANGSGKTTLFRLLAGTLTPDKGTVTRSRGVEVALLSQEPDVRPDRTLHEEVGSAFSSLLALEARLHKASERMSHAADERVLHDCMQTYERINTEFIAAGGHSFEARLNEILGGLGFRQSDHDLPVASLSGGQKCRAALAKLLLRDFNFLLLDEPTNHLDIDAVRWLEKFLIGHHGGVVIISHDRYLLDNVCARIVELEAGRLTSYPGNYTNYVQTRERRLLTQQRQYEKDAAFIAKEQAFIRKHLAGQRTKEAQGRRTRLHRRLNAGEFVTETARHRKRARIAFDRKEEESGTPIRCDELSMRYDEKRLFDGLTFQVFGGERLGITGPNGTGKTTLLRIILGDVAPDQGTVTIERNLQIGYYAQETTSAFASDTALNEIRAARPSFTEQQARDYLARFLFTGDSVFKPLSILSGGEQSRVRLAKLILDSPDVLILDEPTNHLDIPSREALEEALLEYSGTILAVSHDRYLLDRIVDRLLVVRPEGHTLHLGNYSSYVLDLERRKNNEGNTRAAASLSKKRRATARRSGDVDEQRTGPGSSKKKSSPYDRLAVEELEELVVQRETQLALIQERFGDPAVYQDPDTLAELNEQMEIAAAELAEVDAAWQERVAEQE